MSESEIQRSLGRIEGSIDELKRQVAALGYVHTDFEARIKALEALKNKALGIAICVSALVAALSEWIKHRLNQ